MVYFVYRWSVLRDRVSEHDEAVVKLGKHIKNEHPLIQGVRSWKVTVGSEVGRPGRVWAELFRSLTDFEEHGRTEYTPACDEAWAPVFAAMVPGSMTTSIWDQATPEAWFDRD
ncbi:MAG: hypothetical protein ABI473_06145 [Candidatus Dormibacter sp.]